MEHDRIKVGILGLGGIGTMMAGLLSKDPMLDLQYYSRTARSKLKLIKTGDYLDLDISIQTKPKEQTLDWLLVCLKKYQLEDAKPWFENLIGAKTKVVVLRNGLDLKAEIMPFTKAENIIPCLMDCPVQRDTEGNFVQLRPPVFILKNSVSSKAFTSSLNLINMEWVDDFPTRAWKKLLESSILGGLLCYYNSDCLLFEDENMVNAYKELMLEAIQVAKAEGAIIEPDFVALMVEKLKSYPSTKGSSMLSDYQAGKRLELNAKNGILIKKARKHELHVPKNEEIFRVLKAYNTKWNQ